MYFLGVKGLILYDFCVLVSILYQRGVYPAGSFERMDKYELTLFLTNDPVLNDYLTNVLKQVKGVSSKVVIN